MTVPILITAERFKRATGHQPQRDDLERCNCAHAGEVGHWACGWDIERDLPRYMTIGLPRYVTHAATNDSGSDDGR